MAAFTSTMVVDEQALAAEPPQPQNSGNDIAADGQQDDVPAEDADFAEPAPAAAPAAQPPVTPPPAAAQPATAPQAPPAAPPAAPAPVLSTRFRARLEAEAARRAASATGPGSSEAIRAAELERREAELARREAEEKRLLEEDPQEFMRRRGVTFRQVTERVLEGQQPHHVRLQREVEELRQWREELQQQQAAQEEQAAAQDAVAEVRTVLQADPRFELIRTYDAWPYVLQTIQTHFQQTGQVLSEADAAERVERHLTETVQKALSTQKFASARPKTAPQQSQGVSPAAAPATPLTNQHASNAPTRSAGPLTREAAIERAASKLRFLTGQ